jgi:ABC-2 type transport system permease protein
LSFIGVLTSIWAEKFDHAAAIGNFVVAPLSLLSGTFYSMEHVAPLFRTVSHANPFFFAISGFRYGFLGASDSHVLLGGVMLLVINAVLGLTCYGLLKTGWKTKA